MTARARRAGERALLLGVVLVAVFVAYREALDAWFAADDFLWLEIGTSDSVLASFAGPWGHGAAYRPLSRVSFFIDSVLFGLDARPWHVHSLLVHAGTAALLGWLVRRVSGERALALAVALLFALEPLGYQTAIWISGRSHPLALGLALLALIYLDRFLLAPRALELALASGFLAASLLTYEASVYVLPLAALLVLLRRTEIPRWRAAWVGLAAFVAVTASYLVVRRVCIGPEPMYPISPLDDLMNGGVVRRLATIAGRVLEELGPWPWVVAGGLLVSLLAGRRYVTIALVGCAVVALGYLPFVLVTSFSARFTYASQAGVALVVAAALCGLARLPHVGKTLAFGLFLVLIVGEWRVVREVSHEWQLAGKAGRRALANIVARTPDPEADGILFVVGTPRTAGHAMVFYTYFDSALRVFHPRYGRLAISAHYVTDQAPETARAEIAAAWQRAQSSRRRTGKPPLRCQSGPVEQPGNGSFTALLDCHTLVLSLDRFTQDATPTSDATLRVALGGM